MASDIKPVDESHMQATREQGGATDAPRPGPVGNEGKVKSEKECTSIREITDGRG